MSLNINLLQETIEYLQKHGHTPGDVLWVGSYCGHTVDTWDSFAAKADFDYYAGYGGQEVANDIVVVGKDWWMERFEYDGSECWSYKKRPTIKSGATGLPQDLNTSLTLYQVGKGIEAYDRWDIPRCAKCCKERR